jgi:PTH1 family peptidyl-tRNA hydrolase
MPKQVDWLIIGLGNPGSKYAETRHNIGWMVATHLASKYKKPIMQLSSLFKHSAMRIDGKLILVALPITYMNNSGEAAEYLCREFKILPEKTVVILDEYNFDVGKVHLKKSGGHGGHNGLASIIEHLDTRDFFRLRCGIGKRFPEGGMVDYVLSNFLPEETERKKLMIEKAVEALEHLIKTNPNRAMGEINSEELWIQQEKKKSNQKKTNEDNDKYMNNNLKKNHSHDEIH